MFLIEQDLFRDTRGLFFESFNQNKVDLLIGNYIYVQDNISYSSKNVVRGLHFQVFPFEQGKLVQVISGKIIDVIVNIKKESPNYGKWQAFDLSEEEKKILWIPPGYAHGFQVISDHCILQYKVTNYWNKKYEHTILYNDKDLNIKWRDLGFPPIVSENDSNGISFNQL